MTAGLAWISTQRTCAGTTVEQDMAASKISHGGLHADDENSFLLYAVKMIRFFGKGEQPVYLWRSTATATASLPEQQVLARPCR